MELDPGIVEGTVLSAKPDHQRKVWAECGATEADGVVWYESGGEGSAGESEDSEGKRSQYRWIGHRQECVRDEAGYPGAESAEVEGRNAGHLAVHSSDRIHRRRQARSIAEIIHSYQDQDPNRW